MNISNTLDCEQNLLRTKLHTFFSILNVLIVSVGSLVDFQSGNIGCKIVKKIKECPSGSDYPVPDYLRLHTNGPSFKSEFKIISTYCQIFAL